MITSCKKKRVKETYKSSLVLSPMSSHVDDIQSSTGGSGGGCPAYTKGQELGICSLPEPKWEGTQPSKQKRVALQSVPPAFRAFTAADCSLPLWTVNKPPLLISTWVEETARLKRINKAQFSAGHNWNLR